MNPVPYGVSYDLSGRYIPLAERRETVPPSEPCKVYVKLRYSPKHPRSGRTVTLTRTVAQLEGGQE